MIYNKKNRGAASIIVVVMVSITLVFALVTTFISLEENKKVNNIAKWNEDFYTLDKEAVYAEYKIIEALMNAEKKTMTYMVNKEYENANSTVLPIYAQNEIESYYNNNSELSLEEKLNVIMDKLYLFYANAYLVEVVNYVPEIVVTKDNDSTIIDGLTIKCVFETDENENLKFEQTVNDFGYNVEVNDDSITYTKLKNQYVTTENYYISQPLKE